MLIKKQPHDPFIEIWDLNQFILIRQISVKNDIRQILPISEQYFAVVQYFSHQGFSQAHLQASVWNMDGKQVKVLRDHKRHWSNSIIPWLPVIRDENII
jgi:hypothetical protein